MIDLSDVLTAVDTGRLRVLASGLRFPEGPVALADGTFVFVEIERGTVLHLAADGTLSVVAYTGGGPNGLAVGPDGAYYVCNNGGFIWHEDGNRLHVVRGTPASYAGGSIQRVDPTTGAVQCLYDRCGSEPLCGPNDIVFDAHGGFYFTDYGKARPRARDIGAVYYALPDGSRITETIHPIMAPNGIGLSPDGKTLYVAETDTARLWAFAIQAPGRVAHDASAAPHGGRFVCGLPGYQRMDSLALQADGHICVATLITGSVAVISPQGRLVRQLGFPDPDTTNLCFFGPDLCSACVTQSSQGRLLALNWDAPGLKLHHADVARSPG